MYKFKIKSNPKIIIWNKPVSGLKLEDEDLKNYLEKKQNSAKIILFSATHHVIDNYFFFLFFLWDVCWWIEGIVHIIIFPMYAGSIQSSFLIIFSLFKKKHCILLILTYNFCFHILSDM